MLVSLFPAMALASDVDQAPETTTSDPVPAAEPTQELFVSDQGDDDTGSGSKDAPYATLQKAVEAARDGAVIYVMTDLEVNSLARVTDKHLTITSADAENPVTLTRGSVQGADNNQSHYNSAMIEVTTNGEEDSTDASSVTLTKIVLTDNGEHDGTYFAQTNTKTISESNLDFVQDGMVTAHGKSNRAVHIILGDGAVLEDYGGMSALYGTMNAHITMKAGSAITAPAVTDRVKSAKPPKDETGAAGAVWLQGAEFVMESGAEIHDMVGRAVYCDGGTATIGGTIFNLKGDKDMWQGTAGVAVHVRGDADATLVSGGKIHSIQTGKDENDTVIATYGSDFTMDKGSEISGLTDVTAIYADDMGNDYGHNMLLNGTIQNCTTKGSLMRSWYGLITVGPTGLVTGNTARGAGGMLYTNNGSRYCIQGALTKNTAGSGVMYLANQSGGRVEATIEEGAQITDNSGLAIRVNNGSWLTMNGGTISGNATAVQVSGKDNFKGAKFIMNGGTISDNTIGISYTVAGESVVQINGGTITNNKTQISATGGSAKDANENLYIASGVLQDNTSVSVSAGTVTLDTDYTGVALGQASTEAKNALTASVAKQHADWTAAGSYALWIKPENKTEDYHFTITRPSSAKKTSLFAAYLPLKADGTPVEGAEAVLTEVKNEAVIDVTLPALTDETATAYALLFFNNKEYTLKPDDITIYTGGGHNDEEYDNGFPELSLFNCLDLNSQKELSSLEIDGKAITEGNLMEQLVNLFTVTYQDADGNPIVNDEKAGEYIAVLSWKDGTPKPLKINGNNVKDVFETGTLIIRYTEDQEEAEDGTNTYPLLSQETPAEPVKHAEAYANKGFGGYLDPEFHINGDSDREITNIAGISILDDSLLLEDENDNRQQLLEDRAAEVLAPLEKTQTYVFDFHYLDLVDAYNGNAWVTASYGTTVYLPYPAGTGESTQFTLVHYKDLHREYGISGQANVEEAIKACDLEVITTENTPNGIKFEVAKSGFSPFALVWATDACTITASAGEHGSIAPSGEVKVAKGTDQTFTITADAGYHISDVKVDGKSVGTNSTYTFEKVAENHTIEAVFAADSSGVSSYTLRYDTNGGKAIPSESKHSVWTKSYEDLPTPVREDHAFAGWYLDSKLTQPVKGDVKVNRSSVTLYAKWSNDPVDPDQNGVSGWLNTKDHNAYLNGHASGSFGPDKNMTRAEAAQMFYNLLLDKEVSITVAFRDVPENAWYAEAVNTLASLGILEGVGDGRFAPDRAITRAEFTAIAMRFTDGDATGSNTFSDVHTGDWFYDEVVGSVQYGWIAGYADGTFRPNKTITRAEVTAIVNRMLNRTADKDYVDEHLETLRQFPDLKQNHWAFYQIMEAVNSHQYTKTGTTEDWTKLG